MWYGRRVRKETRVERRQRNGRLGWTKAQTRPCPCLSLLLVFFYVPPPISFGSPLRNRIRTLTGHSAVVSHRVLSEPVLLVELWDDLLGLMFGPLCSSRSPALRGFATDIAFVRSFRRRIPPEMRTSEEHAKRSGIFASADLCFACAARACNEVSFAGYILWRFEQRRWLQQ